MAAIGKIRKQGKLLATLVGGGLILFIAQSAFDGTGGGFNANVGTVAGEEISYKQYAEKRQLEENKARRRKEGRSLNDQERNQISEQVWRELTINKFMEDQRASIGIGISEGEILDLMELKPDPQVANYFADPQTRQFSRMAMANAYSRLNELGLKDQDLLNDITRYLSDKITREKYDKLIEGATYSPRWQSEQFHNDLNRKLTAKYVLFNFDEIKDEEVEVTDKEIENYIRQNKAKYSNEEETRKVEYVSFPVYPSVADTQDALTKINGLVEEFKTTSDDSTFVAINSDKVNFDKAYLAEDKLAAPSDLQSTIYGLEDGQVYGPYLAGNSYFLAKMLDKKTIPDSVECRHILLKVMPNETREIAVARKDSIMNALKAGADFATLARKYSQDPGSAVKGGDLGYAKPGQMVKEFNDKIFFEGDKDELLTCQSQFGFHIIDVTKYKPSTQMARVAYVNIDVVISDATSDSVFNKALDFYSNATKSDFTTVAKELKLDVRVPAEVSVASNEIGGLKGSKVIVNWAFQKNEGDISSVADIGDNYVVAYVADVKEKGMMGVEDARKEVEYKIRTEKKGQMLIEKYKDAINAGTLEEIAQKSGKDINTISEVNFHSPFSRELGRDMKVIGTCFGLNEKEVSEPVIGVKGVYVVMTDFYLDPKQVEDDYADAKAKVEQAIGGRTKYGTYSAIQKSADIEDLRFKIAVTNL